MAECRCRPTRIFALMMLLWFVMLLQAYMHNYNIVYLMLFFTMAISAAVYLSARANLRDLSLTFLSQERIFAGEAGRVKFGLTNRGERVRFDLFMHGAAHFSLAKLGAASQHLCNGRTEAHERGVLLLETLQVESYFPLALFHCRRSFISGGTNIRVYPRPEGKPLHKLLSNDPAGFGDREDFDGLRRYERGDPLAAIHWKASARNGVLYTKRFTHTTLRPALHFDYRELEGEKEARLSQLCLWVLACEKEGRNYTLTLGNSAYDSRTHSTDEVLDALARF